MKTEQEIIIYYQITAGATGPCATILNLSASAPFIFLPPEIAGMPVTAIAAHALQCATDLPLATGEVQAVFAFQKVIAAHNWKPTTIAEGFACTQLSLPDSITHIGDYAFCGCTKLEHITLPEHLNSLSDHLFSDCHSLRQLSLPPQLTEIQGYAFHSCQELRTLRLPPSVTAIGRYAFYNCRRLEKINLPAATTRLGTGLFLNCDALSQLEFGACQGVSDVIAVLNHQLILTIDFPDGRARLIIPDFQYEYIEDTPARMFHQINYGTGHLFRQCIGNGDIDFRQYDQMFYLTRREDEAELVLLFCVCRLCYPYRLLDEPKQRYLQYLREHLQWAVTYYIKRGDLDTIRSFAQWDLFNGENLPMVLDVAQSHKKTNIVSFLMDFSHQHFPKEVRRKQFDL